MTDKKIRRSAVEINKLVTEAQKLINGGMPKTVAVKKVGINYITLQRHTQTSSTVNTGKSNVKDLLHKLEAAIRAEVIADLRSKIV